MKARIVPITILSIAFMTQTSEAKNTLKAATCQIKIVEVIGAQIFRGPPYMAEMLARNPENAELIRSESHGDHHLTCTYKTLLNRRAYEYKVELSNTRRHLKEEHCNNEKLKEDLANEITAFTSQCRFPKAKAAVGSSLKPLD